MVKKFFRKLFGPITKTTDKIALFRLQAIEKAESISKGEKVLAPHYPTEEKHLKEIAKNKEIRKIIDKKQHQLIEHAKKITITSTDPSEPAKSKRELPKRPWEYEHVDKQAYEYGFYEPPPEKLESNRLMFREAIEILRARMELELVPEEMKQAHKATAQLKSNPAVKRVDKEKLDTVWEYFRPFTNKREQKFVQKDDIQRIYKFIEGSDTGRRIHSYKEEELAKLHADSRNRFPRFEEIREMGQDLKERTEEQEFRRRLEEKHEKEMKRLEERLKQLNEMDGDAKTKKKQ